METRTGAFNPELRYPNSAAVSTGVKIGEIVRYLLTHYKDRPCVVIFCPARERFFIGQKDISVGPFGLSWDGQRLHPDVSPGVGNRRSPELSETPSRR